MPAAAACSLCLAGHEASISHQHRVQQHACNFEVSIISASRDTTPASFTLTTSIRAPQQHACMYVVPRSSTSHHTHGSQAQAEALCENKHACGPLRFPGVVRPGT